MQCHRALFIAQFRKKKLKLVFFRQEPQCSPFASLLQYITRPGSKGWRHRSLLLPRVHLLGWHFQKVQGAGGHNDICALPAKEKALFQKL